MKNKSKKFTMKILISFVLIIFTALIYLVSIGNFEKNLPSKKTTQINEKKNGIRFFKVAYKAATPGEEKIADILWIQKAAKMTKNSGFSYFKIKHRVVKKEYEKKYAQELTLIEGMIEATDIFVTSAFDVEIIDSLLLQN
jgi:hypothetical protein